MSAKVLVAFLGTVLSVSCQRGPSQVSELLSNELDADVDELRIEPQESSVIEGLVYYWGIYTPETVVDAVHFALAGEYKGNRMILRSPADWMDLAQRGLEDVHITRERAVALCVEVIRQTGPTSDPLTPPVLFRNSTTFDSLPSPPLDRNLAGVPLHGPRIVQADNDWIIDIWMLELDRAAQYTCQIEGAELTISEVNEAPGAGLIRY